VRRDIAAVHVEGRGTMTEAGDPIVARVMRELDSGLGASLEALAAEQDASPVLVAVVEEFRRKYAKTRPVILGSDERLARESLIELEQAADSARYAALADPGVSEERRDLIVDTHDWVCTYTVTGKLLRPDD
jgi:hypothetical protein